MCGEPQAAPLLQGSLNFPPWGTLKQKALTPQIRRVASLQTPDTGFLAQRTFEPLESLEVNLSPSEYVKGSRKEEENPGYFKGYTKLILRRRLAL
jgi:hypothetical protein